MSIPFVVKYAPKLIQNIILDKNIQEKFNEYIIKKDIPNLLFCGNAGTGKTTSAKILAKEITDSDNILYINASDERSIDTIRNKVKTFCSMVSFGGLRIIILDEFDGMTPQAMEMMRNTMEEFIENSRFILTCNYDRKIIDPIKSRCQIFTFTTPDELKTKTQIIKRCAEIIKLENITAPNLKEDLIKLVTKFYPDIRSIINNLEKLTVNNTFKFENIDNSLLETKLIKLIHDCDIKTIRKEILGLGIDYNELYRILFNNAENINIDKKIDIMLLVGDAVRWHSQMADPEINFVTCILNIMAEIKK